MNEIFTRRSVRKFKDTPVEDEKIVALLQAGMAAPSAGNQQPWEFYVVRDKEVLRELSHCSLYAGCAAKAPAAIVVCSRDDKMRFRAFANLDLSACVENILLEAVHLDLAGRSSVCVAGTECSPRYRYSPGVNGLCRHSFRLCR